MLLSQNTFTIKRLLKEPLTIELSPETLAIAADSSGVGNLSNAEFAVKVLKDGKEIFPNYDENAGSRNLIFLPSKWASMGGFVYNQYNNSIVEEQANYYNHSESNQIQLEVGEHYTLSFDCIQLSGDFFVELQSRPDGGAVKQWIGRSVVPGKNVITFFCNETLPAGDTHYTLRFFGTSQTLSVLCEIKDIQLEKGNNNTEWTPAPEDLLNSATISTNKCTAVVIDNTVKITTLTPGNDAGWVDVEMAYGSLSTKKRFTWALAKSGVSISNIDVEYAVNTSTTVAPTTGWATTAPAISGTQQLWTRTKTSYSTGSPTYSTPANITPQIGKGVVSIIEEYYLSTSKTTQTGGSWVTSPPAWSSGKYLWTRSKITYSNPTSTAYTTPVVSSEWEAVNDIQIGGENIADRTEIAIVAGAENSRFDFIKGNLSSTPVSGSYLKNNQAHVLTISESIRIAGTATHYSVVLFDFTQGLNTYQQEFTFSTAKRVIKFTTPATGNWSLLIYAGVAGATAGNTVEYKGIMLQEGNKETAYQSAVKYLTQAIEGSTEISGGLVATNIMLLKNALEQITGGLSGLDDDNIGFWTGGTYTDALAGLAKIILRKDGSGQLAGGSLSWDLLGQLLFGKVGDSETIKISTGAIPDLAEINNREEYSLPVLNEQVIKNLNNPAHAGIDVNTTYNQEFTLENDGYLSIDAAVMYAAGTDVVGFGTDGMIWLEKFNGTSWVTLEEGIWNQTSIYLNVYQYSVTKGRFRVRWDVVCGYTDVQGSSATITLNKYCEINYKLNVKKLVIGIDGIALFDSMSDKYLRLSLKDNVAQLRMKLDTDMPGVLASGSITSGGGNQNPWGAKKSTNNATYTATGIYDVPHNAGSTYQVQVTPTADNIECKVVLKSNNTFRVQVRSNSGTATTGSFDYVIFGKN